MTTGILFLGFGGHARSLADVALAGGIDQLAFFDENALPGENFLGFPVENKFPAVLPKDWAVFPASGDNQTRREQLRLANTNGWNITNIISHCATIGVGATIGKGIFIGHHAHVGPMTNIGDGVILNTASVVEHESKIGAFSHISINASVAGRCTIGDFVFLGAGSIIRDRKNVADHVTIGAGGVVISSIDNEGIYVGVPVQRLKNKEV